MFTDIVRSNCISACYLYPYNTIVMTTVYDHMSHNTLTRVVCDSTESVDITICFSSLSNWLDGQRISRTKKLPTLGLSLPVFACWFVC